MSLRQSWSGTILVALVTAAAACQPQEPAQPAGGTGATGAANEMKSTAGHEAVTELQINDIKVGDGATATPGQTVVVHYTGWLYDPAAPDKRGAKFDSSHDHNAPFDFPLGGGRVIQGWDQGVAGMKVGGRRELIIPAQLGYGARGAGGVIPPDATLVFEVELLDLR